ncbi:diguanylate cyclase/phosphodiesterase [Photobacterium marinum]|uniref:diguanylate cyclase n=1 Tax=Photobacterium marinum TaxID=1056511 RepID=L8JE65_9GAMM|nr:MULTISPECIES: GGDEF domain-containing protein [Photobacterium]ELR65697.1 diguanylate cyclase/phosphodiesterase [Photobacterium marinum]
MNRISQLPPRRIALICTAVLFLSFIPANDNLKTVISIVTLVLSIQLVREDFGTGMRGWLLLSLGMYGVGVITDLLDDIPELHNHWFLDNTEDIFIHVGVFMTCFCFIKILHQHRQLIESLNQQIDKARNLEQKLSRQALHDELTGLENRRALFRCFDHMAIDQQKGMLAYIDLDNFKQVNDNFGHQSGDQVLIAMATTLLRTTPAGSRTYRIGGDEFVVLLSWGEERSNQKWIDMLYEQTKEIRGKYNIGISIGLAPYYPGNLSDPDSILAKADQEMYSNKEKDTDRRTG